MSGNFALDISRWCNKAKADTKSVIQNIAMETFKRVILRSPVDTGRFRANWGVMVGSPYTGVDESARDKSGKATIGKAEAVTIRWNAQGLITCCTNLSYAHTLEYGRYPNPPKYGSVPKGLKKGENPNGFREFRSVNGFSLQAPQGMVRVTAAEITAWAQSAANVKESIGSIMSRTN